MLKGADVTHANNEIATRREAWKFTRLHRLAFKPQYEKAS